MPELPEVEATRRHLLPVLEGATITHVEVRRPRMVRRQPRPRDFGDRVLGRRVEGLGRRGKLLEAHLSGDITWVTHLGMSGRLTVSHPGDPEAPHTNVIVRTDRDDEVRMIDPRTFGFVAALTPAELVEGTVVPMGPDALTGLPRTAAIARRMAGRTIAVKSLLLDQRFLAGLGNIYADEVLHRARIRPDRRASSLDLDEIGRIRKAIRPVLEAGLRSGGTSLDDLAYLLPDGRAGEFANRLRVYGREGEPCRRCGTAIERIVLNARSSFWCPTCQT